MLKKKTLTGILSILMSANILLLTGCNEAQRIESVEPLSFDDVVLRENELSELSTERKLYNYLSRSISLDSQHLVRATSSDEAAVSTAIGGLNIALATGKGLDDNLISDELLNYMLWEFSSRTPYAWQYDSSSIIGFDAATRLFFVDVTYKTSNVLKSTLPVSSIVLGDTSYDSKMLQRQTDYSDLLSQIYDYMKEHNQLIDPFIEGTIKNNTPANTNVGSDTNTANPDVSSDGTVPESAVDVSTVTEEAVPEAEVMNYLELINKAYKLPDIPIVADLVTKFENSWGDLETILAAQTYDSLLDKLRACNLYEESYIGQVAFPGLADVNSEVKDAKLTFRIVFDYNYLWGSQSSMSVQTLYLKDYTVGNADGLLSKYTNENVSYLKPYNDFIDDKIHAYLKATSTVNHYGLNNLFENYGAFDAYYKYMGENTYRSFDGFHKEFLGVFADKNYAAVKLTLQYGLTGKGSSMSLPTYNKESILLFRLTSDENLKIIGEIPLSEKLVGEPLSVVRNISGISDQLLYTTGSFSAENEQAVYDAVGSFAALELEGDVSGKDIVDLGISATSLAILQQNISELKNLGLTDSYVFIQSWGNKSNSYCVLNLREVYLGDSSSDTNSTLSLINTSSGWRVISYVRTKTNSFQGTIPDELAKTADFHASINDDKTVSVTSKTFSAESDESENSEVAEDAEDTEFIE